MDERAFVSDKQESWNRLSESLDQVRKLGARSLSREQLEFMGQGYRMVVSDLAFVRSQGASENLIGYLNDLAGRAHGVLYASESAKMKGIVSFLLRDFPALFRATFRYSLVAMLVFVSGWLVSTYLVYSERGMIASAISRQFGGKMEVRPSGHAKAPHEVFIGVDPAEMSSMIMTNNIKEGIYAFVGGATFGVLSVGILFWNGLMIGGVVTLAMLFVGPGYLLPLLLPHGIIELTAIFICGGAGLLVGSAMIAPGNIRRVDSMRVAAGKSIRLFAGAVPMFVVAATIEGFITPSAIPSAAKLTFAGLTAIGLVLYLGFAGAKARA